ncbi:uncharacterized protein LOC119658522 [Hermetia illucens]|nr:uncharacterized protein LOC119658522 [Hermetia illucens]XP_037921927.1 uncharacterized protein LOC119658522 [Hermetia illucens]XP_037921929.1 uncharacterized protein LOC119658522 [Hermetia illucens]
MLEPYQPKFQQQHRSSCPLVDLDSLQSHPRASVSRMSMGMAIPIQMPPCQFSSFTSNIGTFPHSRGYATFARPRQNSVFVGPQVTVPKPPRKTRSAMDLHSMVEEGPEPV